MRKEKVNDFLRVCFCCKALINYGDFLKTNCLAQDKERFDNRTINPESITDNDDILKIKLEKIWLNENISLFCCDCFRILTLKDECVIDRIEKCSWYNVYRVYYSYILDKELIEDIIDIPAKNFDKLLELDLIDLDLVEFFS